MTEAAGEMVDWYDYDNAKNNLYLIITLNNLVDQKRFTLSIEDDRFGKIECFLEDIQPEEWLIMGGGNK